MITCGDIYFDCDQIANNRGWLVWPVISVSISCEERSYSPCSQWIKPYASWEALGYGREGNVLDFCSPTFVEQLKEAIK